MRFVLPCQSAPQCYQCYLLVRIRDSGLRKQGSNLFLEIFLKVFELVGFSIDACHNVLHPPSHTQAVIFTDKCLQIARKTRREKVEKNVDKNFINVYRICLKSCM